jgi:hypothetical protein
MELHQSPLPAPLSNLTSQPRQGFVMSTLSRCTEIGVCRLFMSLLLLPGDFRKNLDAQASDSTRDLPRNLASLVRQ